MEITARTNAADVAGALRALGPDVDRQLLGLVGHWGLRLQARVKANAAGRPGPRMVTGDYNRSIAMLEVRTADGWTAMVGTNKPQGRRLEFGFRGTDSLGRTYDQDPFPHFGPAIDAIQEPFAAATARTVDAVIDKHSKR